MQVPRTFVERIGAAVLTPRAALVAADAPQNAGRTGSDAAALLAIVLAAVHTQELVVAAWLGAADGIGVGLGALVQFVGRATGSYLIAILVLGGIVTVAAGPKRSILRDFDLACVAFVPFAVVALAAHLVGWLAGIRDVGGAALVVAGTWSAAIVVLAVLQARRREDSDDV